MPQEVFNRGGNIFSNEAHIFIIKPDESLINFKKYFDLLSKEEKNRAKFYHYRNDAIKFLIAHIFLRLILSRYLRSSPKSIIFKEDSYGCPFIAKNNGDNDIEFSLSYAKDAVVLAISKEFLIGVDIEHYRQLDFTQVAQTCFSQEEFLDVFKDTYNKKEIMYKFFLYWTMKEACTKLLGYGLSMPLQNFSFKTKNKEIDFAEDSFLYNESSFWQLYNFNNIRLERLLLKEIM